MTKEVEEIKDALTIRKRPKLAIHARDLLSTGSTVFNLACSGKANGGIAKGTYALLVGDSDTGKSWLAMTLLAEAANNKQFDNHELIYNNAENGVLMNIEHFFGKKLAGRLTDPSGADWGISWHHSDSLQGFYYHLDDLFKKKKPFIEILDSMDALTSDEDDDKFAKQKSAAEKGKRESGSYGMSRPKLNSQQLRKVVGNLQKTGSILVIISQTRDNIGFGSQFNPKTFSGGNALTFYAHMQIWTSLKEKIKTRVKGKPRQLGINVKVRVKRSRLTGKDRTVEVPIYHSIGIDDIGGMLRWLVEEGHWKKQGGAKGKEEDASSGKIVVPEWNLTADLESLAQKVEAEGRTAELRQLVEQVWNEIEDSCIVQRKARYQ